MAKVYITTTAIENDPLNPYSRSNYRRLLRAANSDKHRTHQTCSTPDEANIILFVGARYRYHTCIRQHPLLKKYPNKCFVFDENDQTIPSVPGLYMGLPKNIWKKDAYRTGFYLRIFDNNHILQTPIDDKCPLLFWFKGKCENAPVRKKMLKLHHERGVVMDSNSKQNDSTDIDYFNQLSKSKFVLCPRGIGPSTWRLFETMAAGRVPVIIADDWKPIDNIEWETFSIKIAEHNIMKIPEICATYEKYAPKMGRLARETWERKFSLGSAFQTVVDTCLDIAQSTEKLSIYPFYKLIFSAVLNKSHIRPFASEFIKKYLSTAMWSLFNIR